MSSKKAKNSLIVYGAVIGFMIGFAVGFAVFHAAAAPAPVTHEVVVSGVRIIYLDMQTGKSYLGGVLTGFNTALNSAFVYNFTVIYKNDSVNETIYNMTSFENNFKVLAVYPSLPATIPVMSDMNFSLTVQAPNATYSGPLNITVLYGQGG